MRQNFAGGSGTRLDSFWRTMDLFPIVQPPSFSYSYKRKSMGWFQRGELGVANLECLAKIGGCYCFPRGVFFYVLHCNVGIVLKYGVIN